MITFRDFPRLHAPHFKWSPYQTHEEGYTCLISARNLHKLHCMEISLKFSWRILLCLFYQYPMYDTYVVTVSGRGIWDYPKDFARRCTNKYWNAPCADWWKSVTDAQNHLVFNERELSCSTNQRAAGHCLTTYASKIRVDQNTYIYYHHCPTARKKILRLVELQSLGPKGCKI